MLSYPLSHLFFARMDATPNATADAVARENPNATAGAVARENLICPDAEVSWKELTIATANMAINGMKNVTDAPR